MPGCQVIIQTSAEFLAFSKSRAGRLEYPVDSNTRVNSDILEYPGHLVSAPGYVLM